MSSRSLLLVGSESVRSPLSEARRLLLVGSESAVAFVPHGVLAVVGGASS